MEMSQPEKWVDKQHEREKEMKVHVIFDGKETILETTCYRFFSDVKYCFALSHPEDCILVQKFIKERNTFVDISPFDIVGDCSVRIALSDKPCQIQPQRSLNHDKPVPSPSAKFSLNSSIFNSSIEAEKIFVNFKLPQFSEVVQNKLDCGRMLDSKEKLKIISALGDAIRTLTYYPLVAQLFLVAEMFLKKYPYLVKDINPEIGKQSWARELQEHFVECGIKMALKENEKKSSKCKKRKKKSQEDYHRIKDCEEENMEKATQTKAYYVYEDMSAVVQRMNEIYLMPFPDMEFVQKCMRITYLSRRNFIFTETPTIALLKQIYRPLFNAEEIKNEFHRYTGKNPFEIFREKLKTFSSIIFNMPGSKQVIKNEIIRAQSGKKEIDVRLIPILLIPSLMDEDLNFLCFRNERFNKKEVSPWINCNATLQEVMEGLGVYKIYIDNRFVCEPVDLIDAVYCLIASYFVFNIVYPQKCLKFLQIFQSFFLEIEEDEATAIPIKKEVDKFVKTLKCLAKDKNNEN